jgi:hypothetical protein
MKIRKLLSQTVANTALAAVFCIGIYEGLFAVTGGYSLVQSYQAHNAGVMYIEREEMSEDSAYMVDGVPQIPPLSEYDTEGLNRMYAQLEGN